MESGVALRFPPHSKTLRVHEWHCCEHCISCTCGVLECAGKAQRRRRFGLLPEDGNVRSLEFGFWDLIQGQFNRESAPLPDGAAHKHPTTVRFDDMFHDGQTDADALGFAAQFGSAPIKRFEYSLVLFRRNAVAAVFDPKLHRR